MGAAWTGRRPPSGAGGVAGRATAGPVASRGHAAGARRDGRRARPRPRGAAAGAARALRAGRRARQPRDVAADLGRGVRRPGARRPDGEPEARRVRPPRRAVAAVLDGLRDNGQDRGLLRTGRHEGDWEMVQYALRGGRLVRGGLLAALAAPSVPGPRVRRTARGRRSCSSPAAPTRPTSSPACATARGPIPTTTPTAGATACGRGSSGSPPTRRRGCAYPGRWGAARGLGPGRDGLAARPGVPAPGPLERPGRLGRRGAPCTR